MTEPLLALRQITKRFPGIVADDRVDFDAHGGEVHALLGENGAGKSTLMKVAYGYYPKDGGEIRLAGKLVRIGSPADARREGIGMVFQNFTLIPAFTVAENIALYLPHLDAVPSMSMIEKDITSQSDDFGLDIAPATVVGTMAAGQQQKVEILKLLMAGAKVLIFDEPTSVLPPHEIESLFAVFRRLTDSGYAVVFITHKLDEVLRCADRITVMRRGAVTGTLTAANANEDALLRLMFGSSALDASPRAAVEQTREREPALELEHVSSGGAGLPLKDVDLCVRQGEIVGIAGVSGNGQRELGDVVLGLLPIVSGRKLLFGADATRWPVARIREERVAYIAENPGYMSVAGGLTLAENYAVTSPKRYARAGGLRVDWELVREDMAAAYRALSLEPPDAALRAGSLSGGQLQRFSLARELGGRPRLIVAVYPTRGLDARTTGHAEQQLVAARNAGSAVLFISQDLDELFALSDRIVVLHSGRIVGTVTPAETTQLEVGRLMTGGG